jgi:hypothetical protein
MAAQLAERGVTRNSAAALQTGAIVANRRQHHRRMPLLIPAASDRFRGRALACVRNARR